MITIKHIAEAAAVSSATVSLVLSGRYAKARISEDTRQRVLKIAKDLGYRRNDIARSMVTGKTRTIAFLSGGAFSEHVNLELTGALLEAQAKGYTVHAIHQDEDGGEKMIRRALENRVQGILCAGLTLDIQREIQDEIKSARLPSVFIGNTAANLWEMRVLSDDFEGCRLAVEYLRESGQRRIAFASCYLDSPSSRRRKAGFEKAMGAAGLPIPEAYSLAQKGDPDDLDAGVAELLALAEPPTAIFCTNDPVAMIVIRATRRAGKRVPQDVSIIGFADLQMAAYADPPLTTIAQPFMEMGRTAMRRVIDVIETNATDLSAAAPEASVDTLPVTLIRRASCL